MADVTKQTALVQSIADGVHAKLAADFTKQSAENAKLAEQLAKLAVTTNSILARLETLESAMSSGPAAKRGVRTGPAAAKGAAAKPAGKKAASGEADKVTNALLFCRYMLANDIENAQEVYGTKDNLDEAEKDATVAKRNVNTDPTGYWSAVGAALWKTVFTDEQKEEIRAQYTAWKEENARDAAKPQLDEDA